MSKHVPLRHIVLFRCFPDADDAKVSAALEALRGLRAVRGVLELSIEESLDRRKGRVIVENLLLADHDALEDFRTHPLHTSAVAVLATMADWWVGDYEEPQKH